MNKVTGGRIPREYIPSVDAGAQEAMQFGILAGYEMAGVRVTLLDGGYHEVDSSELAFKIAGSQAFKEAARKASPVLLEPMMAVEVTTPEDYMGDVIGDINSRRGQIQAMEERSGARVVKALVPALGDVRLRRRPPQQDLGSRKLLDAVRLLRRGSAERRRGDHREGQGRVTPLRVLHALGLTPEPPGHPPQSAGAAGKPRRHRHPSKDHLAPMSKAYRTTPQEDPSGEGEVRAD